ncbi:ADP-ribosylglycohydrolase family protein [Arcobacteraceae bacterium]|nr:ADP-ribosylglycohydrolase family protein [Arcobacteraceae bacterium]
MFNKEKSNEIIKAVLTADSYSLGAHWVYDETQLANLPVNWETLNDPQAMWHKGKKAGDFTHIGDQLHWLNQFVQDKKTFDASSYLKYWQEKMSTYDGYIDGATRNTLANIEDGNEIGSDSDDFSVIGRISPLLMVSKDEEEFVTNVQTFVKLSHNTQDVIDTATFFARLLFRVNDGKNIEEEITSLKDGFDSFVSQGIEKGIASKGKNTFDSIRNFGPACGVNEGLPGIIHLLLTYPNDLKELLTQNAKAGGDTSSRSMVATMIIVSNSSSDSIPKEWFEVNKNN